MSLDDEEIVYPLEVLHHHEAGVLRVLEATQVSESEDLLAEARLEPPLDDPGAVAEARARRVADLERLDPGVKRLVNPHVYHVSVTRRLAELKSRLAAEAR
jgi:nicotinate phosphoribosyltransferase